MENTVRYAKRVTPYFGKLSGSPLRSFMIILRREILAPIQTRSELQRTNKVAAGVYFYTLTAGEFSATRKNSELNNAGFYIYRSETQAGEFKVVNPTMIAGAGTTGERTEYSWTDTTAKPNTVYYYRIEDMSHAGVR